MINWSVNGEIELQARIGSISPACIAATLDAINKVDMELAAYIVDEKLSGQVLNRITGNLQSSIRPIPAVAVESEGTVTGGVEQDNDVAEHGKWQEFGAYIPAMNGPMSFNISGVDIFTMHTRGHRLPVRSFMRSALRENRAAYEAYLVAANRNAALAAWNAAGAGSEY